MTKEDLVDAIIKKFGFQRYYGYDNIREYEWKHIQKSQMQKQL